MVEQIKGTENFIAASEEFYDYLAKIIRGEISKSTVDLKVLRELSEIIKINSGSMKTQKEEPKGKSKDPLQKVKGRTNGQVVA